MQDWKEEKEVILTADEANIIYWTLDLYFFDLVQRNKDMDCFPWVVNLIHVYDKLKDFTDTNDDITLKCSMDEFSAVADYIYYIIPIFQETIKESLKVGIDEEENPTLDFQNLLKVFLKFSEISDYRIR